VSRHTLMPINTTPAKKKNKVVFVTKTLSLRARRSAFARVRPQNEFYQNKHPPTTGRGRCIIIMNRARFAITLRPLALH
jgi:hypothetical protein